ncbi:AAA family ATPase [Candidatus Woesearchaeota archaeon]|nr:AAA family ATPase [Candidatus Woesearchaeota archaeon]
MKPDEETQEARPDANSVLYGYSLNISQLEEENKVLKHTVGQLKTQLDQFKKPPLILCEVRDIIGRRAVVRLPNGNQFLVEIAPSCKVNAGDTALAEQKNLVLIKKVPASKKFNVERFVIMEKPKLSWKEVGGLEEQIREIKEIIELPMMKPQLFRKVGIHPPKGILLHGEPGTGKTLLAKAVAASTNSTFIEIVASELVQKFIGEGAKLVKEVFDLARENAPAIVFIDELDALAARRIEIGTSGEREVQRTFMQFLAEIDGFKPLDNVKVIACTNRKDILDPAIVRPGRLDRLIHVPLPNDAGRREIFKIHSKDMTLRHVNVEEIVSRTEGFSGAEIKAVCTEAGYFAIRENRTTVKNADFLSAVVKVRHQEELEGDEYLRMFG